MAKKKASGLSKVIAPEVDVEYKPSPEAAAREKKWQAEEDIRTIQRAEEIKRDKSRMSEMKKLAKEQMKDLQKACK